MTSCPPLSNDNTGDGATTGVSDDLSDDSTGNSNDAATENESTAVEDEVVVSNNEDGSINVSVESSDETTSQSGGGSFWLPILMFALAFRRPICAPQMQY